MPPKIFARGEKLEDGHYTVLEEIGVGGMGVVYHCRDELLLRDVAIKMLLPSLMADKKNLEVFKEEARLAAQLEHPNIVTVYDIGVESRANRDHHFVAMEYLPGGNLAARVTQGPLPLEHALNWMKQLASGLSFAHKRGVVHQDIKADNIFITNEGDLKIGDFGLARLLVGRVYLNSSTKGMGTPAYMSPELCRGEQQDHRSDIYSMGILFFEMCTGQLPFRAQGMIEMAMKHTSAPVPSAKRLNPHVPEVLDKVIKRMMAKTPEERYKSMADVLGIVDDLIFELRVARMGLAGRLETGRLAGDASEAPKSEPKEKAASVDAGQAAPRADDVTALPPSRPRTKSKDTTKVVATSSQNKLEARPANDANLTPSTNSGQLVLWKFASHGPIGWSAAPVQDREGKNIFVPSSDGRLYSLASETGALNFAYDAGSPILSAPLYLADKLIISDCLGVTHALNPQTAEPLWQYFGQAAILAPATAYGNTLILCDMQGQVTGLDLRQGRKLWNFSAGDAIVSQPRVHGDSLYFASRGGSVFSIACATGRLNWKFVSSGNIVSSPVTSVDTVYIGTQSGSFFALDAEAGRLIWEYPMAGAINRGGAIVFTSVMFATNSRWLYCCEKYDGSLKWKAPLKAKPAANLIIQGNQILSLGKEGTLESFDTRSGASLWRYSLKKEVESIPLISGSKLYFGAVDGEIIALDLKNEAALAYRLEKPEKK